MTIRNVTCALIVAASVGFFAGTAFTEDPGS